MIIGPTIMHTWAKTPYLGQDFHMPHLNSMVGPIYQCIFNEWGKGTYILKFIFIQMFLYNILKFIFIFLFIFIQVIGAISESDEKIALTLNQMQWLDGIVNVFFVREEKRNRHIVTRKENSEVNSQCQIALSSIWSSWTHRKIMYPSKLLDQAGATRLSSNQ